VLLFAFLFGLAIVAHLFSADKNSFAHLALGDPFKLAVSPETSGDSESIAVSALGASNFEDRPLVTHALVEIGAVVPAIKGFGIEEESH
jgi:hypothetical protein